MSPGAHVCVDTKHDDAAIRLESMGGVTAIVATTGDSDAASSLMRGLARRGLLVLLGGGKDPLPIAPRRLVVAEQSILGSITGTPHETEKALAFSVLTGARPRIEAGIREGARGVSETEIG